MSRRTPVTLHDPDNPIGCEFFLDRLEDDWREVLIVRFVGKYRIGHLGQPDAAYMAAMSAAAEVRWEPQGIVLDLSGLEYEWGDNLDNVLNWCWSRLDGPGAVVVGGACKEAIRTLLFGVHSEKSLAEREDYFEDLEAAVAYVRKELADWNSVL
jgi:hypothetical protein